ncbi:MAG: flagellar biosynthesis protein FlhA [Desulfobacterales bacterium]|jgi:flagellar biosynthesis protein FlhA|nr:flagellar biosynthesis protein FlhA [Desulfobacterales bacterium]
METKAKGILQGLFKEASDFGMILAVVGILVAMVLPIPSFMLDFLLALNITIAIIVLITVMYAQSPLDFSIFPSMLLILTLFRLSLNVASTRLILLRGNEGPLAAGAVIKSFGSFVVGGNYVVGMIIFIILVLINFIVITKGSGRIAEVAARFTLDGMPGKQMAIDADLNAGIIDENEAKARREEIANESKFHGAMDGASKFVRGDAIAGIIITIVNIVGGFIIGVFQKNMSMMTAAQNYTLLTVGDGLVSQIPALIISTAAGILVSRAASNDRMGKEFSRHIFSNAQPIYIGSFVVFLFGLVPGLPAVPFIGLSLLLGGSVYFFQKQRAAHPEVLPESTEGGETEASPGPEDVEHLLSLDTMELEVGYGLIPLVDRDQDGSLLGRIRGIRRQFASEMGIIIPPIHIRDNLKLKPSGYRIVIKGVEVAQGELMVNHLLAMDPGDAVQKVEGVPTKEPAFNLPAIWIPSAREEEAKFSGYTVVDNATVVATHLTEVIRENAPDLMGRQEVQQLLDNLAKTNPKAVEELVPGLLHLGGVQKVLQNLLRERISVRDLLSIVETLADYAHMSRDPDLLTEYVRQKLCRSIISPFLQSGSVLPVIKLDGKTEEMLTNSVRHTEQGSYLAAEPGTVEAVVSRINDEVRKCAQTNLQPILLTTPVLRRHLRKLIEPVASSVMVISHAEIVSNIRVQAVGKVAIRHDG